MKWLNTYFYYCKRGSELKTKKKQYQKSKVSRMNRTMRWVILDKWQEWIEWTGWDIGEGWGVWAGWVE